MFPRSMLFTKFFENKWLGASQLSRYSLIIPHAYYTHKWGRNSFPLLWKKNISKVKSNYEILIYVQLHWRQRVMSRCCYDVKGKPQFSTTRITMLCIFQNKWNENKNLSWTSEHYSKCKNTIRGHPLSNNNIHLVNNYKYSYVIGTPYRIDFHRNQQREPNLKFQWNAGGQRSRIKPRREGRKKKEQETYKNEETRKYTPSQSSRPRRKTPDKRATNAWCACARRAF